MDNEEIIRQLEKINKSFDLHVARIIKLSVELETILTEIKTIKNAEISDL